MSELDQIKAKIAETERQLKSAETKLSEAEVARHEANVIKYEDQIKIMRALLIQQQEEKNLLLKAGLAHGQPAIWFLAESIISTAHKRGLRGTIYDLAGSHGAFHCNVQKSSIFYESDQSLRVRVLFPAVQGCGKFQSMLEKIVKRYFDADAVIAHLHSGEYPEVVKFPGMAAVLSSHYISSDNPDSDEYSIYSHRSAVDDVEVDQSMQPILWENVDLTCFQAGSNGTRCHLMSRTSYTQHAANDNNIMIMSGENHSRFDGYSPKIAIRWGSETDQTVLLRGEELTYCKITIVCLNEEVFRVVGKNIKVGAERDPANFAYSTSIAVQSPLQFRQFLTFKYLETLGLQARNGPENQQAKLRRVRADVVRQMRELFPDLSIDLELRPKNKRNIAAASGDED